MDPEESSIERLKRTLYSRDERVIPKEKRTPVSPREIDAPTDWGSDHSFAVPTEEMTKKNNSFFNKFFLGSLVFFLVSFGVASFIFFGGMNMISSNNLNVVVTAPASISSGEELPIGLSITNGNRTDLEEVSLFVNYPEGAKSVGDDGKALGHEEIKLGTIAPGKSAEYTNRSILFGEKDAIKSFVFRVEYRVKGSNAVFSKEKTYDVVIGSSPLLVSVDYPKEINSGQAVTFSIEVTSNSPVPVKNALIKIEYPYGFSYKSSNLPPLKDSSVWNLGDLKNGDTKKLSVVGVLIGQNMEDRSFRVSAGTKATQSSQDIDTVLSETTITMGIRKSFFDLTVSTENNIIRVGETVPVSISWENTLPDRIVNNQVRVELSGTALDRSRVTTSGGGFYQSVDNTILWDKNTSNILANISPGDSGRVLFAVSSLSNLTSPTIIKNPYINVHVEMTGDRVGRDTTQVSSTEDLVIKIPSVLNLLAKSNRDSGTFSNTGPIPPRADKESTYTITWSLTNTTNDLKDTVVTAVLPQGVSWKGEVSPLGEKISFNQETRTIMWTVGNIASGVGYQYSPRSVSFKLGLIPSINQIGSVPNLTSQINVVSVDTYANKQLNVNAPSVTTKYSDPSFVSGNDTVGK